MSADHDRYLELSAAHALGCLDEADRLLFEEHLSAGCAECESALADFSEATVLLAASAPEAAPSPGLRARVIKSALAARPAASATASAVERRSAKDARGVLWPALGWSWGWAAAAAALAVVTAVGWMTNGRLRTEVARLGEDLRVARERIATLETESAEENRWARVLTSPEARVATLVRTPDAQTTLQGRAVYDPASRAAVIVLQNVYVPGGHDFQLWAIKSGAPASLGLIHPDKNGFAVVRVPDAGDSAALGAFAISLEPAGGSPNPAAPSGPVVMVGKLGG